MITLPRIICQALRDPATLAQLRPALTNSLAVANPFQRQIVEFAGGFWDKYQTLPKPGDWEFWTATLQEPVKGGVTQTLSEIRNHPEESWTPEFIVTEVAVVLKDVAARAAVARLGTMVPNVPANAFELIAEEIRKIEPVTIHGLKDLKDVGKYIYGGQEEEIKMKSGIQGLDSYIGGFRPELIYILADSGVGKTTMLLNIGSNAALHGARILHITFELSAENTLRRYYRKIAQVTGYEVREDPVSVVGKVGHWLRFAKGWVHVLYLPAYSVGANEFESLLDQYVHIYGGVDGVILDYLDLMKPEQGSKSEYEGLGKLSHRVRNAVVAKNAAGVSATQATRGANTARHLRLDMMGDSYGKVRAADIILGVIQTPEEFDAMQGRLSLLKIRENPGRGVEIPLFINMDRMLILDLDHPNSRRIAEMAKVSTSPVFQEDGE